MGMSVESDSDELEFVGYFKDSKYNITMEYEILDALGDGAYSVVQRARQIDNGKKCSSKDY